MVPEFLEQDLRQEKLGVSGNSRRQGEWAGKRLERVWHRKRRGQTIQGPETQDEEVLLSV